MTDPVPFPPDLRARYTPQRILGRGGFGVVFLAEEIGLGRLVVLKFSLTPQDEQATQRMLREGRILAGVQHPNIVKIYDVGETASGPYLAMEFLPGRPLHDLMPDPLGALTPVLDALEAVHAAGLVHRDVKPENILQCDDGRVVLVDFGLALAEQHTRLTATGLIIGTLPFLAPEILRGERAVPATDWYGWGASLYWLLVGQVPCPSDKLLAYATGGSPPEIDMSPIPEGRLQMILKAALHHDPKQRATGAHLRRLILADEAELAAIREASARTTKPTNSREAAPQAAPEVTQVHSPVTPEVKGLSGAMRLSLFTTLLMVMVGVSCLFTSDPTPEPTAPPPTQAQDPPPAQLAAARQRLDRAIESFDSVYGLINHARYDIPESEVTKLLGDLEPKYSSLRTTAIWTELMDASFAWVDALPEARRLGDEESQEVVCEHIRDRTKWLGWIGAAFEARRLKGQGKRRMVAFLHDDDPVIWWDPAWDMAAIQQRRRDLKSVTLKLLKTYDRPERRNSPLWAKLMFEFALHSRGFGARNPEVEVSRRRRRWIADAMFAALINGRGPPASWRQQLLSVLDSAKGEDFVTAAQRLEYYRRGLAHFETSNESAAAKGSWLRTTLNQALESARCFHDSPELHAFAEETLSTLQATCCKDRKARDGVVRELLFPVTEPGCPETEWVKQMAARLRTWSEQ